MRASISPALQSSNPVLARSLRPAWQRYVIGLGIMSTAIAIRTALDNRIHDTTPFLFLTPATIAAAWFGGFGPGVLATAIGILAGDHFLRVPNGGVSGGDVHRILLFVLVGVSVSGLSGTLYDRTRRFQLVNQDLESRVRRRTRELEVQSALLQAQSEASRDGILVIQADQCVGHFNSRFQQMWQLPQAEAGIPFADLKQQMLSLVQGPGEVENFLALPVDRATGNAGELHLSDGRVIDCFAADFADVRGQGQVWYFRDVTERKALERELLNVCEREQRRIGQDLHDGLGPHLVGISLLGKALEDQLKGQPTQAAATRIAQLIDDAIVQSRQLAMGLRPVALEAEGFFDAMQQLCESARYLYKIDCRFEAVEAEALLRDGDTATHLYRIAQEAVNNAVKHGPAGRVLVRFSRPPGYWKQLQIESDGRPFPSSPPIGRGLGLQIMRYRAEAIGARLNIQAGDAGGTVVTVTILFPSQNPKRDAHARS